MRRFKDKLNYANVISTLCLFLLLGGGAAFAAGKLGKNSVGTKQIKNNAVTSAKIKKEAITAAKVKKGTLTGTQINASTLGTVPTAQTANSLAAHEAWHEVGASGQPAFANSWTNSTAAIHGESVAFYKDHEGNVHLRGLATGGESGKPIFFLPPGFRPAKASFIRPAVGCTGGTVCEKGASNVVIVGSSFTLPADEGMVLSPGGGATDVFLDGVTFPAGS